MFDHYFEQFQLGLMMNTHMMESAIDSFNIRCLETYCNYSNGFITEGEVDEIAITESSNFLTKVKEFFKNLKEKIIKFLKAVKNKITEAFREKDVDKKLEAIDKIAQEYKKANVSDDEVFLYSDNEKFIEEYKKYIKEVSDVTPEFEKATKALATATSSEEYDKAIKELEYVANKMEAISERYDLNSKKDIYVVTKVNISDAIKYAADSKAKSNAYISDIIKNSQDISNRLEASTMGLVNSFESYLHEDENSTTDGQNETESIPAVPASAISEVTSVSTKIATEVTNTSTEAAKIIAENTIKNTDECIKKSKKKFSMAAFKEYLRRTGTDKDLKVYIMCIFGRTAGIVAKSVGADNVGDPLLVASDIVATGAAIDAGRRFIKDKRAKKRASQS